MSFLVTAALLAATAGDPAAFVDRWHAALRGDQREAVLALMLPDAVVFEGGEAEMSRDVYAEHHLGADMEFARGTTTKPIERRVIALGEGTVVVSETASEGSFQGRRVSARGVETMVLRRVGDDWRVAHIHWSSRRPAAAAPAAASHVSATLLADRLRAAGVKVEDRGETRHPFFAVPARVLGAGDDEIHVFEFPTAAEAEAAAGTVGPTGGTIGTSSMHWIAAPHVHRKGRTIVIHLGGTPVVKDTVVAALGPQFAGRP